MYVHTCVEAMDTYTRIYVPNLTQFVKSLIFPIDLLGVRCRASSQDYRSMNTLALMCNYNATVSLASKKPHEVSRKQRTINLKSS